MSCSEGCTGGCGSLECGEGAAGLNGLNAFTVTTADFNQPTLINTPVTVSVSALGQSTGIWAKVGQTIFIEGGGYYEVTAATATTVTVEIPDSNTLAYNQAITPSGNAVTFPAGVSPAGVRGPQGATGSSTTGQDGTTQLVTVYGTTAASGTSYSALHPAQILPSSASALLWPTAGSVLRLHLASFMSTQGNQSNHWRGEIEIVLDGVSITLPLGANNLSSLSYGSFNGMTATVDIVAVSLSPLTLIADVKDFQQGYSPGYSGTLGYVVIPTSANTRASVGNPFTAGQTTGVDQSSDVVLQVNGRRNVALGTPGGSPSVYLPMLKVERLIKP